MDFRLLSLDANMIAEQCRTIAAHQIEGGVFEHPQESIAWQAAQVIETLLELCRELRFLEQYDALGSVTERRETIQ